MRLIHLIFILCCLGVCSCGEDDDPVIVEIEDELAFNFIGHPRMPGTGQINPQLLARNWKEHDVLVLGGDLDNQTASSRDILDAYDEIFEFSDPNTIVSLGNHDYSNLDDWEVISSRKSYYTSTIGSTVFFISDNQSDRGSLLSDQLDLFNAVMDTISEANTFVFLSHKLIWLSGNSALQDDLATIPNGEAGTCWHCTNENNFYQVVYPKLIEVEEKGIQIICLAGDVGNKTALYEKQTEDNIFFLANGWNADRDDNRYLKFYKTKSDSLSWELIRHDE